MRYGRQTIRDLDREIIVYTMHRHDWGVDIIGDSSNDRILDWVSNEGVAAIFVIFSDVFIGVQYLASGRTRWLHQHHSFSTTTKQ